MYLFSEIILGTRYANYFCIHDDAHRYVYMALGRLEY